MMPSPLFYLKNSMLKHILILLVIALPIQLMAAETLPKVAIVPGGDPKPDALLVLAEAKLFELKNVVLLERVEIDKVLAEQKLSGMFNATNAIELGRILKTDIFAVLEPTSIVIFDAQTGLRLVDETLPIDEILSDKIEEAAEIVAVAVSTAVEKRQKLDQGKLVTFGVLEVRNADFPVDRDGWCRAVAGMLERSLLHRGGAVLERSRLQLVNRERQLTGDTSNDLLASMKLIDLEFTRGETMQTFKITARIGDKTYRAESPIDKPLNAVQKLAEQLSEGKVVVEASLVNEAARFLTEARFLERNGRLSEAIETVETAIALNPTNPDYRGLLVNLLTKRLCASTFDGNRFRYDSSLGAHLIDSETMRQAVQDVFQREALRDSLPRDFRYGFSVAPDPLYTITPLAYHVYPEYKGEFQALHRRFLDLWVNESYRVALDNVADKVTFQEFLCIVGRGPPRFQKFADHVAIYAEIVENTLRLSHQYELDENLMTRTFRDGDLYRLDSFLDAFSRLALQFRLEDISDSTPEVAALIERTLVLMEQDSRSMPQIYAWIARNRPSSNYFTREYFEKVRIYLSSLPVGLAYLDSEILYDELAGVVGAGRNYQSSSIILNDSARPHLAEILELADSRNEFARKAVDHYIDSIGLAAERTDHKAEFAQIKEQMDPVVLRQLALAERLEVGPFVADLRRCATNAGITEIPVIVAQASVIARPWTSEIDLFPKGEGYRVWDRPTLRGNLLLSPLFAPPDSRFGDRCLGIVNLDTLEKRYIPLPHNDWTKSHILYFDGNNIFFHVRDEGLLVYPLDGSEPWRLTFADGLSGAVSKVLGVFGNQCYAVCGVDWVIRMDLETRQWEQLSSSRAKEGKTPFVNGRRADNLYTLNDPKRERIFLMQEDGSSLTFWTIEKDGKFVPIRYNSRLPDRDDGRLELLFFYGSASTKEIFAYDHDATTVFRSEVRMYAGCAWNGYLWGMEGWGRAPIDNPSEVERLPVPEAVTMEPTHERSTWYPVFCNSTADGKHLVVGSGSDTIILLRFE